MQGCSLRCPGCCNPELLDPAGGDLADVAALLREIRHSVFGVEGLTVLGGEPFDQAPALAPLARGLRRSGLGVVVFTGYTLAQLHARGDRATDALLRATDLLVDGPYDATQPETHRRWVGSRNQQFHYLSDRYHPSVEEGPHETVEIRLRPDGVAQVNGWPALGGWARRLGRPH